MHSHQTSQVCSKGFARDRERAERAKEYAHKTTIFGVPKRNKRVERTRYERASLVSCVADTLKRGVPSFYPEVGT